MGDFWVNTERDEFDVAPDLSSSELDDAVNHPSHYTSGKIEVSDFIEDQDLNFFRGNVVKYVVRAGLKAPEKDIANLEKARLEKEIEDLEKANWYLNREIRSKKENLARFV